MPSLGRIYTSYTSMNRSDRHFPCNRYGKGGINGHKRLIPGPKMINKDTGIDGLHGEPCGAGTGKSYGYELVTCA